MDAATVDELAALADGALAPGRRAEVRAVVAASSELARLLRVQLETAQMIRTTAAQVDAPHSLRVLVEKLRAKPGRAPAPRPEQSLQGASTVVPPP